VTPPDAVEHGASQRIAGQESYSVYRCTCGCVHVHIGAFTVRLGAEAFLGMATVIGEAASALTPSVPNGRRH
jgi:hypothetical protein